MQADLTQVPMDRTKVRKFMCSNNVKLCYWGHFLGFGKIAYKAGPLVSRKLSVKWDRRIAQIALQSYISGSYPIGSGSAG